MVKYLCMALTIFWATSVQASMGVSCLIYGKLLKKTRLIGESKYEYSVVIKQSADDLASRNDFEDCQRRFQKGQSLVFSSTKNIALNRTSQVWLLYGYGNDRGGARWEDYQLITQVVYKERKNGILR